jgi:hypothetical protein
VTVLLLNRLPQPRHRSLDALGLERRRADRALSPVGLLDPDALYGCRLIASTPETLMPVAQGLGEVLGRPLRRDPGNPRGTRLARVTVRRVEPVLVDQRGQGRTHPPGIAGGLRCKALEWWCAGW